jgi:hypothetical protein
MEALALRVRNELAAAGLPVLAPGVNRILVSGAEVEVDGGADAASGIFVGWSASPRLRECAVRAFRLRLLDDPLLRHSSQVGAQWCKPWGVMVKTVGCGILLLPP